MGTYIIKLDNQYLLWSTVVDAPVSYGMKTQNDVALELEMRGQYTRNFPERMERVEKNGISATDHTLEELFKFNRAGPNESCLTKAEIIAQYCNHAD